MSKNINQVFTANPITENEQTDLMYFGQSPYGPTDDAAMLYSDFVAPFQSAMFNTGTDTGVADAYVVSLTPAVTTYTEGLTVALVNPQANLTSAPTLDAGDGANQIYLSNFAELAPGDIQSGATAYCIYLSGNFVLLNPFVSVFSASSIIENTSIKGTDAGIANAYVYTNASFPNTFVGGQFIVLLNPLNDNTGDSTLDPGNGAIPIVLPNGSTLSGGEILGGQQKAYLFLANPTGSYVLMNPSSSVGVDTYANSLALLVGNVFNAFGAISGGPETSLDFSMLQNTSLEFKGTFNNATSVNLSSLSNTSSGFTPSFNALLSLDMPVYAHNFVAGDFAPTCPNVTSVNLPNLIDLAGAFNPNFGSSLTTLSLPSLTTVTGLIGGTFSSITSWSMPVLTTSSHIVPNPINLVTSIDLSSYSNCTGSFSFEADILTELALPALTIINSGLALTMPALVTFSMNAGLLNIGGDFTIIGASLDQASVDGILVSLAALDGTGGTTTYDNHTVNLSGGSSSTPGATGLTAKATLMGRGNTVTTN